MKSEVESRIKPEWVESHWVIVADVDLTRLEAMREMLVSLGFVRNQILFAYTGADALTLLRVKKSAILFLDDSLGVDSFREAHASLRRTFGPLGFFLYAITEGNAREFVQFSASARVDGILFRPFRDAEFKLRISEAFAVKWQNRIVESSLDDGPGLLTHGANETELFQKAIEKEHRLGNRDPLTPDSKITSIFGLKSVSHPAIKTGKKSFEKVRLSFKAIAQNGVALGKAFSIHPMEIDGARATFECSSGKWEKGDHISIEADIVHGAETYLMRIEATLIDDAEAGFISVEFDAGNRTRFEAAMQMVAKRFKELKDFFKYAKGA